MVRMIALLLAALAVAFVACGPTAPASSGKACTSDGDCGEKALCHPTAQICVQSCAKSDECPAPAKTCEALALYATDGGVSAGPSVCRCTADSQCGDGNVCSTLDQVCLPKCTDASTCQGRACEAATGQCRLKHCEELPSLCSPTQYCDSSSKSCREQKCDPDAGFVGSDGGPSSCGYGEFCPDKAGCARVPEGGCTLANSAPAWDAGARGPVIISAKAVRITPSVSTECGTASTLLLTVKYYAPTGLVTSAKTGLTIGENVNYDEGQGLRSAVVTRNPPAVNGTFGEFDVGYCPVSTVNTQVGIHLIDDSTPVRKTGNALCVSLP